MQIMPERVRPPGQKQPTIQDLLGQHKNIRDIPDEALEAIGYTRIEDGDRIIPKSRIGEIEREKQQKQEAIERKKENVPFETLSFEVSGNKMGRRIDFSEVDLLFGNLEALENAVSPEAETCIKEIDGDGSPLSTLLQELKDPAMLEHLGQVTPKELDEFLGDIFYDRVKSLVRKGCAEFEKVKPHDIQEKHTHNFEDDDFEKWPGEASIELYESLERLRGKLADPDFYREESWQKLTENQPQGGDLFYPVEMSDETQAKFGNNIFDISKRLFARILERHDLHGAADKLLNANQISQALNATREHTLASDTERELRERMKTATNEEKRALSGELKTLKSKREFNQRLLAGVATFFLGPEAVAQYLNRKIKSLQRQLVHGGMEGKKSIFTLDARPDETLDRNPGAVSGDCTDGRPLPFDDLVLPLYNVKVYDPDNKHVGNIYLLSTTTKDDKTQKVWHLDAIQIPVALDWDVAIRNIFSKLETEAREKGISLISVNAEQALISNYDYIGEATDKFLDGADYSVVQTEIDIPNIDDEKYSEFQGDGNVFALVVGSHREGNSES
mgnify:FL=1